MGQELDRRPPRPHGHALRSLECVSTRATWGIQERVDVVLQGRHYPNILALQRAVYQHALLFPFLSEALFLKVDGMSVELQRENLTLRREVRACGRLGGS